MHSPPRLALFSLRLLLTLPWAAPAVAQAMAPEEARPAAWSMQDGQSPVVLLGSIHVLPASMAALPRFIHELYDEADTLVMELAMDQFNPITFQQRVTALGRLPPDRQLQDVLGPQRWAEAAAMARAIDLQLELLNGVRPWLAALTVTQIRLMQMGFSPDFGIEMQLTSWATRDRIPMVGLETVAEQLAVFADISEQAQVEMLMQSLNDAVTLQEDLDDIIGAWASGDVARMEDELLASVRESPELYEAVAVQRNRAWIEPIEALLQQPGTHLVVVGALHLVGEDSVIAMLEARGHTLQRL